MRDMIGIYSVYKNGELIAKSPNLITDLGKSIIFQYLGGGLGEWASTLGVGAYNTAATVSDYKLYYEITKTPILSKYAVESITASVSASGTAGSSSITLSSTASAAAGYSVSGAGLSSSATVTISSLSGTRANISHPVETTFTGSTIEIKSAKSIKFRSRLPEGLECYIYEIGLFNVSGSDAPNRFEEKIITNFDESVDSSGWTSGSAVTSFPTYPPRLGGTLLKLSPAVGASVSSTLGDGNPTAIGLSTSLPGGLLYQTNNYSSSYDTGKVLIYSSASGASVTVVGQDTTTGKTTNTITILQETAVPAGGPWVLESAIIKNIDYNDNLSKIEVRARSSASVDLYLDSLKFSYTQAQSLVSGMISRSVLPTPISKGAEETVEIEYEIFLFP